MPRKAANAVHLLIGALPVAAVRDRLEREGLPVSRDARGRLAARHDLDLIGFLNGCRLTELRAMGLAVGVDDKGGLGALRQRLWIWGASWERRGLVGTQAREVQRAPILLGARLVDERRTGRAAPGSLLPAARHARWPGAPGFPEVPLSVPAARPAPAHPAEPESLAALLARADELVGVRLGARGADKGAYGQRVAALLGIARSVAPEPDWRGEVEVKTLAVVRAGGGRWRLKDGPAIAMSSVDATAKARRVLWVVRADEGEVPGAPVLSWFYQELDGEVLAAFEGARHLRPKGSAGTSGRGWYLRRGFFEACGLMASLNGAA